MVSIEFAQRLLRDLRRRCGMVARAEGIDRDASIRANSDVGASVQALDVRRDAAQRRRVVWFRVGANRAPCALTRFRVGRKPTAMRNHRHAIAMGALLVAGCGTAGLDPRPFVSETEPSADRDMSASPEVGEEGVDLEAEDLAGGCTLRPPRKGLWAKFRVVNEVYRSAITNSQGIAQAIALWRGQSTATIPIAPLVCRQVSWNCPWKFYQDPTQLTFADFAIEVCDGTPSFVSANCGDFGAGTYCPWAAQLIELRDCRYSSACPRVPR